MFLDKTVKRVFFILVTSATIFTSCSISDKRKEDMDSKDSENGVSVIDSENGVSVIDIGAESPYPEDIDYSVFDEKYKNKIRLKWVYNDLVYLSNRQKKAVNDRLLEMGKKYVIDFSAFESDTYEKSVNELNASDSPADIICAGETGEGSGTFRAYSNGWFMDLTEYMNSEDGRVLKDNIPENLIESCSVNGKCWGLTTFTLSFADYAYYINSDVLTQLGLETDDFLYKTPDEIKEYLEMVDLEKITPYYIYRDTNNIMDFIPGVYRVKGVTSDAFSADISEPYVENIFENEKAVTWFKTISDFKKAGLLTESSAKTSFFICQGLANDFNLDVQEKIISYLKDKFPDSGEIIIVPFENGAVTTMDYSITGVCEKSKEKELALDCFTTVMTDSEISTILINGIEGVDYVINDEGKATSKQGTNVGWVNALYFGNKFLSIPLHNEVSNLREEQDKLHTLPTTGKYIDISGYDDRISLINKIMNNYYGLVNGSFEDVDAAIEEAKAELKAAGADEIIDEINRQIDEQ